MSGGYNENLKTPWMNPSQYYAILDEVPGSDGVIFEWGSGSSTPFWLENSPVAEVFSIEHDESWFNGVRKKLEKFGSKANIILCPFDFKDRAHHEDVRGAADYATGAHFPIDRADIIIVDGHSRCLCTAYAATMAKQGANLFLHDTEYYAYKWAIEFMDKHPQWRPVETYKPLPEEPYKPMEMKHWVRIA